MKTNKLQRIGKANQVLSFVTLREPIGEPGEQGEVWKAHANGFKRISFAVKIGRIPITASDEGAYKRFKKEFVMLSEMRHPQIVKVYWQDKFDAGGKYYPFYVMEYLGEEVWPLGKSPLLENAGQARSLCIKAVFDTAAALQHLHYHTKAGCHLDVKCSNILAYKADNNEIAIKLIDFGFARFLGIQAKQFTVGKQERPEKISSINRPFPAASEQHHDVWQLCSSIKRILDGLNKVHIEKKECCDWPFDYAHYPKFYDLLKEWASDERGSKAEKGNIQEFYGQLCALADAAKASDLDPDAKGAIRFLEIDEIAMAARVCSAAHAIRIPPRKSVLYTDRVAQLLASPPFTALEYTRQLGFTHLVYPGALGTRFEHSVGVFDLAAHFIVRMSAYPAFRRVCSNPKDALLFLLASLVHDVGHFPYAHQLEEFNETDFPASRWPVVRTLVAGHHVRAGQILKGDLAPILKKEFGLTEHDITLILQLIDWDRKSPLPTALEFLQTVLDGVVDLDKLDYIERDAYHCGVPYGNFIDVERLFETMRVIEDSSGGGPSLAFDVRGVGSLEQLVTARHQMYANVYWHRAVRAATVMFKQLFYIFQNIFPDKKMLENIFYKAGSDDRLLLLLEENLERRLKKSSGTIKQDVEAGIHLARVVSGRNRKLYKAVVQLDHEEKLIGFYGERSYRMQRAKAKEIYQLLKSAGIWRPEAAKFGPHNVLIDCRTDWWPPFEEIQIVDGREKPKSLEKYATTVRQLRESFKTQACKLRVFINMEEVKPRFVSKDSRGEIENVIRDGIERKRR